MMALLISGSRIEVLFVLLFAYLQKLREGKLRQVAETAANKAKASMPVTLK